MFEKIRKSVLNTAKECKKQVEGGLQKVKQKVQDFDFKCQNGPPLSDFTGLYHENVYIQPYTKWAKYKELMAGTMTNEQKDYFTKFRCTLVSELDHTDIDYIVDVLVTDKAIKDEDEQTIKNCKTRKEKVRKLLEILHYKGKGGFISFSKTVYQILVRKDQKPKTSPVKDEALVKIEEDHQPVSEKFNRTGPQRGSRRGNQLIARSNSVPHLGVHTARPYECHRPLTPEARRRYGSSDLGGFNNSDQRQMIGTPSPSLSPPASRPTESFDYNHGQGHSQPELAGGQTQVASSYYTPPSPATRSPVSFEYNHGYQAPQPDLADGQMASTYYIPPSPFATRPTQRFEYNHGYQHNQHYLAEGQTQVGSTDSNQPYSSPTNWREETATRRNNFFNSPAAVQNDQSTDRQFERYMKGRVRYSGQMI